MCLAGLQGAEPLAEAAEEGAAVGEARQALALRLARREDREARELPEVLDPELVLAGWPSS